jgi:hypothetical protein
MLGIVPEKCRGPQDNLWVSRAEIRGWGTSPRHVVRRTPGKTWEARATAAPLYPSLAQVGKRSVEEDLCRPGILDLLGLMGEFSAVMPGKVRLAIVGGAIGWQDRASRRRGGLMMGGKNGSSGGVGDLCSGGSVLGGAVVLAARWGFARSVCCCRNRPHRNTRGWRAA